MGAWEREVYSLLLTPVILVNTNSSESELVAAFYQGNVALVSEL